MFAKKNIASLLYCLPLFIMACLSFTTENGKHLISRLIVLLTVISLIHYRENIKENLNCATIRTCAIYLIAMATILAIYTVVRGEAFSMPRTMYLSALYIIVTPWSKVNLALFKNMIIAGGVACGSLAIYERLFLGITRIGGVINSIPFAIYAGMTLIITLYAYKQTKTLTTRFFYITSMIGSTLAIILSETRGVWLALLGLTAIYLIKTIKNNFNLRALSASTLLLVISFTILLSIPTVQQRFSETSNELTEIKSGDLNSSWGVRIQLWKTAVQAIENHPVWGVGTAGWKKIVDTNISSGKLTQIISIGDFANSHAHNQFLDSYMRLGIVGLAISLIFIAHPILTFKKNNNQCLKLYLPVFLLICGLSDVPLFHTGLIYMIALYPFIIFSDEERMQHKSITIISIERNQ